MAKSCFSIAKCSVAACMLIAAAASEAAKIKDLCEIQGAQPNTLRGTGLVVGLSGTGDKTGAALQAQQRLLERLTIEVDSLTELKTDNAAVVLVTATFPSSAKAGTRIDIQANSLYNAKSLEGGTLMETVLYGINNEPYAVAQGAISTGGFNADGGGGTSVRKNHVTVGRVPMGAMIEREIPSSITDGETFMLLLRRPNFITANAIQEVIRKKFESSSAAALGAGSVTVPIPPDEQRDVVRFIATVQALEVEGDTPSVVVINERTGTVVVGGDVVIKPCQVAHGNLTIEIAATPVFSQPAPFGAGTTAVGAVENVEAAETKAFLMPVQGASASEVAATLNSLKVTPRDMISIFQALKEAGALDGELEIM